MIKNQGGNMDFSKLSDDTVLELVDKYPNVKGFTDELARRSVPDSNEVKRFNSEISDQEKRVKPNGTIDANEAIKIYIKHYKLSSSLLIRRRLFPGTLGKVIKYYAPKNAYDLHGEYKRLKKESGISWLLGHKPEELDSMIAESYRRDSASKHMSVKSKKKSRRKYA